VSHKGTEDKEREGFPFTARQKRRAKGGRVSRKQERPSKKFIKALRVLKKAPRRKK
jgi:hypothetical protein